LRGVFGVELERAFHKRRYVSEDPLANKRLPLPAWRPGSEACAQQFEPGTQGSEACAQQFEPGTQGSYVRPVWQTND
jgi:hypothetical protein